MSQNFEADVYHTQCIVFACKQRAWRRQLCTFHHHQRQLLTIHCTRPHCWKPLFGDSLFCKNHFRQEYAVCCVRNCPRKTYTTHLCRKHYRSGARARIPKCAVCDRPTFALGKCAVHVFEKRCLECGDEVRARGLCSKHYYKAYYRERQTELSDGQDIQDRQDHSSEDEGDA